MFFLAKSVKIVSPLKQTGMHTKWTKSVEYYILTVLTRKIYFIKKYGTLQIY